MRSRRDVPWLLIEEGLRLWIALSVLYPHPHRARDAVRLALEGCDDPMRYGGGEAVGEDAVDDREGTNGRRVISKDGLVGEQDRATVVAALRSVASVVLFGQDTPLQLIEAIGPDVLVKGGDYDANCTDAADPRYIVGSAEVKANGGRVATIDLVPGRSTTAMAKKLKG